MEDKLKHASLNDIRSEKRNLENEIVFKKSFFGGFNSKDVSQNIKVLKDSLQNAERSFNDRLEEHASISTMLTQERDKYMKLLGEAGHENFQLQCKIKALADEADEFKVKVDELSERSLDQEEMQIYTEALSQIDEMKNKINEAEQIKLENLSLKKNISDLEIIIQELNEHIGSYTKNSINKEEYDVVISENESLKLEYDQLISENTLIIAEKNVLVEQNERILNSLSQAYEKNRDLRDIITKDKFKTRKRMAETQVRIYECNELHKQNIEQITVGIKNVLNILRYDSLDLSKLLSSAEDEIDRESFNSDDCEQEMHAKQSQVLDIMTGNIL